MKTEMIKMKDGFKVNDQGRHWLVLNDVVESFFSSLLIWTVIWHAWWVSQLGMLKYRTMEGVAVET